MGSRPGGGGGAVHFASAGRQARRRGGEKWARGERPSWPRGRDKGKRQRGEARGWVGGSEGALQDEASIDIECAKVGGLTLRCCWWEGEPGGDSEGLCDPHVRT